MASPFDEAVNLKETDKWELLVSLYSILEDYYSYRENLVKKGKPSKQTKRKRERTQTSTPVDTPQPQSRPKRARTSTREANSHWDYDYGEETIAITSESSRRPLFDASLEKLLKVDEFGADPLLFDASNSLVRNMIPGLDIFDFEREPLIDQYVYIDQLVMNLSQLAGQETEGKALLTQSKKDFFRKIQLEPTARGELNRLLSDLSPTMKQALMTDQKGDYSMYYVREGVTIQKPYLTSEMRDKYQKLAPAGKYVLGLKEGDLLHVPFSEHEKRVIATFPSPRSPPSLDALCSLLPGRTGIDILRFLDDCALYKQTQQKTETEENKVTPMNVETETDTTTTTTSTTTTSTTTTSTNTTSTNTTNTNMMGMLGTEDLKDFPSEVIIYHAPTRKVKNTCLSTTTRRQYDRSLTGPNKVGKAIAKSLLSDLKHVGKSTAPTEAIVDCKLDPTGKTSKVIVGTARNETTNATNVSVLYDLEQGTINCLTEHMDTVSASDFSIDGQLIITASYDKNIIVRRSSDGVVERYLGKPGPGSEQPEICHEDKILSMVLHKHRRNVISTFSSKQIFVWDIENGNLLQDLTKTSPMTGSIVDMCFASGPYQDLLVVGSEGLNNKGELRLWDITTGVLANSMLEPRGIISSVATNTGSLLISATRQLLRLYDLRQPTETVSLFRTGQKDVNIVSFRYLQSSGTDNRCLVFDARFPERPVQILHHLPPMMQDHVTGSVGINSAIWTHDGNFLVTGGEDGHVRVWDIASGDPLVNSLSGNSPICGCDVSPNFDMIVAGDEAATVQVWATKGSNYTINDEDIVFINRPRAVLTGAPAPNLIDDIIESNIAMLAAQLESRQTDDQMIVETL